MSKLPAKTNSYIALVIVCIVWGTTYFAIRVGVQSFPPFLFTGIRQLVAGFILLGFVFLSREHMDWSIKNFGKQLLIGFLLFCLGNGLLSWSEVYIPSGLAALICSLIPLNIVLIDLVFNKHQHINKWIGGGILLGLLAMGFIFRDNLKDLANGQYRTALILAVSGTIFWAAGTILIKKLNKKSKTSFHNISLQLLTAGIILLGYGFVNENPSEIFTATTGSWWALAYLILFGTLLTLICYQYALKTLPVSTVALYAYVNPFIAILLGVFILNERFTVDTAIAFAMTLIAIYCVNRGNHIEEFQEQPDNVDERRKNVKGKGLRKTENIALSFFIVILLSSCATKAVSQRIESVYFVQANEMLNKKDFFRAHQIFEANKKSFEDYQRQFIEASLLSAFNQPEASAKKINALLSLKNKSFSRTQELAILKLQSANYARLFQYREAQEICAKILSHYSQDITEVEREDTENTMRLWQALSAEKRQQLFINESTVIKMGRDKAGLATIPVKRNMDTASFIFDTGANLSAITESGAKRFGVRQLDGSVSVGSITGKNTNARIGVLDNLEIGPVRLNNVVFLIFPDSALAFPQIGYQIHGIIGFPVIEAMKEIKITNKDEFFISKNPGTGRKKNLAFDFLKMIIQINGEPYTFDSGADKTALYKNYLDANSKSITSQFKEKDLQFGGVGGAIIKRGYEVPFEAVIEDKVVRLDSLNLFSENYTESMQFFYGNIGRDFIQQFNAYTINFKSMYIKFE